MDIRVATLADAHILADLNADFNGVQMTLERMADQMLRCYDVERALIARIDGTAVGFACLRLIPWLCYDTLYAELTELFVPSWHCICAGGACSGSGAHGWRE